MRNPITGRCMECDQINHLPTCKSFVSSLQMKFWSFDNFFFVLLSGMVAGLIVSKDQWANYTGYLILFYGIIMLNYRMGKIFIFLQDKERNGKI